MVGGHVSQDAVNWWAIFANAATVASIIGGVAWAIWKRLNRHFDAQATLAEKFDAHAEKDRKEFRNGRREFKKINRRLDEMAAAQQMATGAQVAAAGRNDGHAPTTPVDS